MQANVTELLFEAGTLLLVGMCVVFTFLALLIGAINLIAYVCGKFPEPELEIKPRSNFKATSSSVKPGDVSPATVAAIGAAIHKYRNSH